MEYCENSNLEVFIKQHKKENKLIDNNVLYYIILDICSGLKEIHNKKIIHRDLKPNNIFISKDYKIKIGDFGISKILKDSDYTNTNYIGTLGYMAPELLSKEKYNNKADIWSLGCIIYELCTLNACFEINIDVIGLLNKIKKCEYEKKSIIE
jgi:NIMA (never in mitosis gene a)-related kinase